MNELRKTAFGEDVEDAKSLSWSREQAWIVLKQLAKNEEVVSLIDRWVVMCTDVAHPFEPQIPYHNVLIDFPFKGDETALRSMEHAELIGIGTNNGTLLLS